MKSYLAGAYTLAALSVALCFLRFWRDSGDPLFKAFSRFFFLIGMERLVIELAQPPREQVAYVYLIRLVAFSVLINAIIAKNRRAADRKGDGGVITDIRSASG